VKIEIKDLGKRFDQWVFQHLNYSFLGEKSYVITGASGSGKSTLLFLLAGLDLPTAGEIWIETTSQKEGFFLHSLKDKQRALFRRYQVGMVFQNHFLLSALNNWENILLPAKIRGVEITPVLKNKALDLAKSLGVADTLKRYPYEVSGGQQQRLSILRAILLSPEFLFCDEPTGALGKDQAEEVMKLLLSLHKSYASTLVCVTHNERVLSLFDYHFPF